MMRAWAQNECIQGLCLADNTQPAFCKQGCSRATMGQRTALSAWNARLRGPLLWRSPASLGSQAECCGTKSVNQTHMMLSLSGTCQGH